jgi:hypothetical protein
VGDATARAIAFESCEPETYLHEGKSWFTGFVSGDYRWLVDGGADGRFLDARTFFFCLATAHTPAMALRMVGLGSQYACNAKDKEGNYLDGSKYYKSNVPVDVPAKDSWPVVVYDPQTRSEPQTSQPFPSKNTKRDDLIYNRSVFVKAVTFPDDVV